MDNTFKPGDVVQIVREWCRTDVEHQLLRVVVEWYGDRGYISPVEWHNPLLVPQEMVMGEMIVHV